MVEDEMLWTRWTPREARRMPWKNGGGTTLELAVEPAGATLETGFAWRLSRAEVEASGPFSVFPGLERTLVLLSGEGMHLDFGAQGGALVDRRLVPLRFPGDWTAQAILLDGPCVDFGLIADPARCRARLEVLRLGTARRMALDARTVMVYLVQGMASVPAFDLHLGQGHLLRVDQGDGDLAVVPGYGGETTLIVVKVD